MPDTGNQVDMGPDPAPPKASDRIGGTAPTVPDRHHSTPGKPETIVGGLPASLVPDVARTVLGTPGVLRLEPTLKDAIRRLDPRKRVEAARRHTTPGQTDGIRITINEATIHVVIDVAVLSTASALNTARAVQSAAIVALQMALTQTATVNVNVLSIEDPPTVTR